MTKLLKKFIILGLVVGIVLSIYNYKNIQNTILRKIYVKKYEEYVQEYSKEYEIDSNLIYAIIKAESNFNEHAISNRGAKGLMQLMYTTAVDVAEIIKFEIDEEKVLEPRYNIMIGTKYISMLLDKYQNIALALAAYNAGSGNVDKWIADGTLNENGDNIQNIPFKETNNYVRKILRDYKIYTQIY